MYTFKARPRSWHFGSQYISVVEWCPMFRPYLSVSCIEVFRGRTLQCWIIFLQCLYVYCTDLCAGKALELWLLFSLRSSLAFTDIYKTSPTVMNNVLPHPSLVSRKICAGQAVEWWIMFLMQSSVSCTVHRECQVLELFLILSPGPSVSCGDICVEQALVRWPLLSPRPSVQVRLWRNS